MPTRLRTFAIVLPVAVALGGCAATDRFTKLPATTPTSTNYATFNINTASDNRPDALKKASDLKEIYRKDIEKTRETQLWFDVPLIGLATGTLASVIYKGSRDLSIGLGLATGTVAAARTYTNPSDRIAALNKGMIGAACVQTTILGLPSDSPFKDILPTADARISKAKQLLSEKLPNTATADEAREFGAAQARLTAALTKFENARALAEIADSLFKRSYMLADATLVEISKQVDSLIVNGTQNLSAALAQIETGVVSARDLINRRDALRRAAGGEVDPMAAPLLAKTVVQLTKEMSDFATDLESLAANLENLSKDIESKNVALARCGVL